MADGNGPGRMTLSGILLAVLILILIVASLYFFIAQPYWFPTLASEHGARIDSLFTAVLVVTGIAFILVQGALGFLFAGSVSTAMNARRTGTNTPRLKRIL